MSPRKYQSNELVMFNVNSGEKFDKITVKMPENKTKNFRRAANFLGIYSKMSKIDGKYNIVGGRYQVDILHPRSLTTEKCHFLLLARSGLNT